MDSELLGKSVQHHGPDLIRYLQNEQQSIPDNAIDYLPKYKGKDNSFCVAVQHNIKKFIAKKADYLFQSVDEQTATHENQDAVEEDLYAKMPPIESFMGVDSQACRQHFYNSLEKHDVVIGVVTQVLDSGLVLSLLCMDNGKARDIDEFRISAFCPAKELPRIPYQSPTEGFTEKDKVRGVVVNVNPETERIIISLLEKSLSEEQPQIKLGLINEDDFPVQYRRKLHIRGLTFDELLHSILGFNNSENVPALLKILNLPENSSFLRGLHSLKIQEKEYAENLRKSQSQKWAHYSVAEGIRLFKVGRQMEAVQHLNKALQIDPTNVEAYVARGALYANNESYHKAIEDFEEALSANPHHQNARKYMFETLLALAKVCEEQDNYDDAEYHIRRALSVQPESVEAREALRFLFYRKDKRERGDIRRQSSPILVDDDDSPEPDSFVDRTAVTLKKLIDEDKNKHRKSKKRKRSSHGSVSPPASRSKRSSVSPNQSQRYSLSYISDKPHEEERGSSLDSYTLKPWWKDSQKGDKSSSNLRGYDRDRSKPSRKSFEESLSQEYRVNQQASFLSEGDSGRSLEEEFRKSKQKTPSSDGKGTERLFEECKNLEENGRDKQEYSLDADWMDRGSLGNNRYEFIDKRNYPHKFKATLPSEEFKDSHSEKLIDDRSKTGMPHGREKDNYSKHKKQKSSSDHRKSRSLEKSASPEGRETSFEKQKNRDRDRKKYRGERSSSSEIEHNRSVSKIKDTKDPRRKSRKARSTSSSDRQYSPFGRYREKRQSSRSPSVDHKKMQYSEGKNRALKSSSDVPKMSDTKDTPTKDHRSGGEKKERTRSSDKRSSFGEKEGKTRKSDDTRSSRNERSCSADSKRSSARDGNETSSFSSKKKSGDERQESKSSSSDGRQSKQSSKDERQRTSLDQRNKIDDDDSAVKGKSYRDENVNKGRSKNIKEKDDRSKSINCEGEIKTSSKKERENTPDNGKNYAKMKKKPNKSESTGKGSDKLTNTEKRESETEKTAKVVKERPTSADRSKTESGAIQSRSSKSESYPKTGNKKSPEKDGKEIVVLQDRRRVVKNESSFDVVKSKWDSPHDDQYYAELGIQQKIQRKSRFEEVKLEGDGQFPFGNEKFLQENDERKLSSRTTSKSPLHWSTDTQFCGEEGEKLSCKTDSPLEMNKWTSDRSRYRKSADQIYKRQEVDLKDELQNSKLQITVHQSSLGTDVRESLPPEDIDREFEGIRIHIRNDKFLHRSNPLDDFDNAANIVNMIHVENTSSMYNRGSDQGNGRDRDMDSGEGISNTRGRDSGRYMDKDKNRDRGQSADGDVRMDNRRSSDRLKTETNRKYEISRDNKPSHHSTESSHRHETDYIRYSESDNLEKSRSIKSDSDNQSYSSKFRQFDSHSSVSLQSSEVTSHPSKTSSGSARSKNLPDVVQSAKISSSTSKSSSSRDAGVRSSDKERQYKDVSQRGRRNRSSSSSSSSERERRTDRGKGSSKSSMRQTSSTSSSKESKVCEKFSSSTSKRRFSDQYYKGNQQSQRERSRSPRRRSLSSKTTRKSSFSPPIGRSSSFYVKVKTPTSKSAHNSGGFTDSKAEKGTTGQQSKKKNILDEVNESKAKIEASLDEMEKFLTDLKQKKKEQSASR